MTTGIEDLLGPVGVGGLGADTLALLLAVTAAYTCASALGFGANVISVALGAHLLPVERLLPVILPTSLTLSAWIAWRHREQVAGHLLRREILPWALLGFPVGMLVFEGADTGALKLLLGAVVAGLALLGLAAHRRSPRPRPRLPPLATRACFVGGGFVQGLFASGGPLVVYVLNRLDLSKGAFRATLCTLWVLLNSTLLVSYGLHDRLDGETLRLTAWVSPAMVVGWLAGQRLHAGMRAEAFRRAVDLGLLVSGLVLVLRGL